MFGTIKTEEQKARSAESQGLLDNLYERINEHGLRPRLREPYKTINRELINDIVHRIDEITDMYYDRVFPDMNDKYKKHNENALLTKRILGNDKMPEASTFDTVLNFVCAVFHFMYAYDNEPHKLFHHCNLWDGVPDSRRKAAWMLCAIRKCDLKYKFMFMYNDENIPSTMERFFSIDDKEIYRLLDLNFP